jgi:formate dehydrogenase major subunit
MSIRQFIQSWPVYRQLTGDDPLGRAASVKSPATDRLRARTATADRVVKSVCPYCAVGCAQNVYVKDEKVVQIEGDPDSPVSRGRLCPKGSATLQLTTGSAREHHVLYRRPGGSDWERLDLATAMDMIADRVIDTRRRFWQDEVDGLPVNRTMGVASLGGATLDNEENYLIKKLLTALGVVQIENQARVCATVRPSSAWVRRWDAAARPRSCRISNTPTASSSRAPTSPKLIRSVSSG